MVIWENRLKTRQLRSADQALARAEEELRTIALSLGRPYSKELITAVMSMHDAFLPEHRRVWRGFMSTLIQAGCTRDLRNEYEGRLEFDLFGFLPQKIQFEDP
jgi:hypothetical protein